MARVTIVVATYNRPHFLKHTIASILKQTFEDWLLLVIGDGCDDETRQQMEAYHDERIFYYNLPVRCGEQSGPNSAGFYIAETEYVAFANHDDIWLPDHLEHAVATLDKGEADFYGAGAALTTLAVAHNVPVAWERTPIERDSAASYFNMPVLFEPVSAWVVRRSLFEKVGAWRPASTIYRTPLEDWVLRAWRKDVDCHFDDRITVLYCNAEKTAWLQGEQKETLYSQSEPEGAYWNAAIERHGLEGIREHLARQLDRPAEDRGWTFFKYQYHESSEPWIFESLMTKATAKLYKAKGWDGHAEACKLIKGTPGRALATMLKRRTGEDLPQHENWREVCMRARKALQGNARWRKVNAHA